MPRHAKGEPVLFQSVKVPKEFIKALSHIAIDEETTVQELVQDALNYWLLIRSEEFREKAESRNVGVDELLVRSVDLYLSIPPDKLDQVRQYVAGLGSTKRKPAKQQEA